MWVGKPTLTEADGTLFPLYPQEARVRNLTYSVPLYVEIRSRLLTAPDTDDPIESDWRPVLNNDGMPIEEKEKAFIGRVSDCLLVVPSELSGSS